MENINTRNDLSGGAGEGMEQVILKEDLAMLERVFAASARECVTSFPVDPVIACRYCHVTLERGRKPAESHRKNCAVNVLHNAIASLTLAQESKEKAVDAWDRASDEALELRAKLKAAEADAATLRQEREILRQRIGMAIGSTGLTKWNPATVLESELQKAREALTCERNARHRAENDLATLRGTKQKQPDGVLAEIQAVLNAAVGSDDANIGLQLAKARQLVNSAAALSSSSGARADEQEQP